MTDVEINRGVQINGQQFIHEHVNRPVYKTFNPKQTYFLASVLWRYPSKAGLFPSLTFSSCKSKRGLSWTPPVYKKI
jgi:hypothetical protein